MNASRTPPCPAALHFHIASGEEEFEAVHRLNHRTFAQEIPQHDAHPDGRLVDRFHAQNTYLIATHGPVLAGMVALRFDRPFSVEQKSPAAMRELPSGHAWCEIRLLAVDPRYRGTAVLAGLLHLVMETARARGCDAGVISATTRQLKLYRHLGFVACGDLIGREGAWYQPMWNTMARLSGCVPFLTSPAPSTPLNLLPGPVAIPAYVREAWHRPAISHRSPEALRMVQEIQARLTTLTGAARIALLAGGGTLGNDVIGGQLRGLDQPGAVMVSGEFGRRLADHAARAGLTFSQLVLTEGTGLTSPGLDAWLQEHPRIRWLWMTHCETSTGVLHPLTALAAVCARRGVKLCLDCVSSLGVVPVDLRGVWLASGASGKGLAAYPGIALVFSHHLAPVAGRSLPRVLDLALYQSEEGMPFTLGSNLVAALHAALRLTDWPAKFARTARHGHRLRARLAAAGFDLSGHEDEVSPAVLTLTLPTAVDAAAFARAAESGGYLIAAHSDYLRDRNQAQICLMGSLRDRDTRHLPGLLCRLLAAPATAPS